MGLRDPVVVPSPTRSHKHVLGPDLVSVQAVRVLVTRCRLRSSRETCLALCRPVAIHSTLQLAIHMYIL